ncbi:MULTISPECIES: competence system sensor histidine kinase ComD [Streptococcus]|jgi:histidine kinase|uniref:Competence system sensor histidine kinase ComD n=3 Tax=Bacillota TaxID=1239 RepID=A0AB35FQC2_STRGN|nr:competence system sensor histidine kinase ComD [Streptococcus gordonii]MBS6244937.1 GHKL domain-containing protein [Streptococcus sp.]AVH83981.1 GHKL domain-containing protein [Streptococcus gordonii]MBW7664199.1 competence system sensor histidine kinase ComD [Streptococcus gordonii]MBZ2126458.1 competence system sensor histidine kinase ComD [Streptococcus gordonii]MBZ2128472.1 competence system sensor histidine kinase ComD [Streptococcus gordonii]
MNFEKIFAIFSLLVQTISFVTVYKKICDIKKLNISIIFLYLTISFSSLILAQFYNLLPEYGDVLSTFLHYLLIFFQPLILHLYFSKKGLYKGYVSIFLSLLIYLSVSSSETFFSVIISSVTGDDFVNQYWGSYYTIVNILALFFVLKSFEFFEFEFSYFKNFDFEKEIMNVIKIYVTIHILLNISHWFSENAHLNSFASMIATIGFIMFLSTLFYLKSAREQYEKAKEIQQKKEEQRQLQLYTDEIVGLYNEIRGFRHDYAGMLTSLQTGINSGDMKEVERIFHNVLSQANISLRSDDYTFFELNNVQDTALRSVLIQTIFKARECGVEIVFEMKDVIETLPMKLLDLVRVASVLLNNAVEGAAESPSKTMNVSLVKLDKEIVFVIQNSRQSRYINLEEIYEVGFSTKGENRGLGLNNVKEIIDKYDEVILETDIETNYFIQVVRFKRKEKI